MKKKNLLITIIILVLTCSLFGGCGRHVHSFKEWETVKEATCTEEGLRVGYCSCGEKAEKTIPTVSHDMLPATCTEPSKCSVCGYTEGEASGHDFKEATCTEPRTCEKCGHTEGEPLGHEWTDATCENPKTCVKCGITEGEALGHTFEKGICSRCGYEDEGEVQFYHGGIAYDILRNSCRKKMDSIARKMDDARYFAVNLSAQYREYGDILDAFTEYAETDHQKTKDSINEYMDTVGISKSDAVRCSLLKNDAAVTAIMQIYFREDFEIIAGNMKAGSDEISGFTKRYNEKTLYEYFVSYIQLLSGYYNTLINPTDTRTEFREEIEKRQSEYIELEQKLGALYDP